MRTFTVKAAESFNGKIFYGDNCKEECKAYESTLVQEFEKEMIGHVIMSDKNILSNGVYIYFITEYGKVLFKNWLDINNYNDRLDITNLNELSLNKWYDIYDVYNDDSFYCINDVSIDQIIEDYKKTYDYLNNGIDTGKLFINE